MEVEDWKRLPTKGPAKAAPVVTALLVLSLLACTRQAEEPKPRRPAQAGDAIDPATTAARLIAMRAAAMTGDQKAVQANMSGMQEDFRKAIKLADPGQRVDHEQARALVRQLPGVRSVVWVDHENLLALVTSAEARSQATIDAICIEMKPLGDTLGVVVNLQNSAARNSDELEILSRNCQLASGDRAMLQRTRQMDVVSPAIRAQHRSNQAVGAADALRRKREHDESARLIEASTPEM